VFGVSVQHVMGMTDVDDKIVKRAAAENVPMLDLSRRFEAEFLSDMSDLGVRPPQAITRVSEHISDIIKYCQKIIDNGVRATSSSRNNTPHSLHPVWLRSKRQRLFRL
jgi:cysteinyl-tRNA synthetase